MTSKEALQELYNEREYLLGEKVNNKTKNWYNDITHYDNIGHCLLTIREELDRLEKLEKENLELKEKFKMLEENEEAVLTTLESSVQENTKLKKVIEDIKNLPDCDICDSNWHKGCMCLQNKFKKAVINNNFKHMFDNCKLTPLPELEELQDD